MAKNGLKTPITNKLIVLNYFTRGNTIATTPKLFYS